MKTYAVVLAAFLAFLSGTVAVQAAETPSLVEVPAGVTIEDGWILEGTIVTDINDIELNTTTQVAIDGNEVYIRGLARYFKDSWVKGTISGTTATFETQFVGEGDYGKEYMLGSNDGINIAPFVFDYDAATFTFTLKNYLYENDGNEAIDQWLYYKPGLKVRKGDVVVPTPVEVPAGLTTSPYTWQCKPLNDVTDDVPVYSNRTGQVNIGYDGSDVYVQGLCEDLPEAWVKGTRDGNKVTFAAGQYFGKAQAWFGIADHYFVGYADGILTDVVINIDENGVYTGTALIVDNQSPTVLNALHIYAANEFTPLGEVAGKPQNPVIAHVIGGNTAKLEVTLPTTDVNGNVMNLDKVYYRVFKDIEGNEEQIVFTVADYPTLTEDMEQIPYRFTDNANFFPGNTHSVNLLQSDVSAFNRVGVQLVNYSGDAENESDVVWYTIKAYERVRGDVNSDNAVNATDLGIIVNIIAGLDSNDNYNGRADVNNDGSVNATDLGEVVNIIAGIAQ